MYFCRQCKEERELTTAEFDRIHNGEEVNVRCECGYLDIMVGAEHDPKENAYHFYSIKRVV